MIKGSKHSEESKLKNSKAHKGKYCGDFNPSKRPEVKAKISKALKESLWNRGRTSEDDSRILAGINHYSYGKHLSEDHKKKISESHKGKIKSEEHRKNLSIALRGKNLGKNSSRYGIPSSPLAGIGKGCYYDSPIQGRIWLRSSYEIAYAKYLDENKILWYYEIETFDLGDTTYTPDFFLPRYNKFIEVKGYMREKYQNKINKFLEQYPWNLDILYKDDLIKLGVEL